MGWNDEELQNKKKGMSTSSKVLLLMIGCILIIIMILLMLLMNIKEAGFRIYVDEVAVNVTKDTLFSVVDDVTYVNIEEFSKLVNYEYHKGEYKSAIIEDNKCYVEGENETASFYLNDNKVYKLLVNKQTEQYDEYQFENEVKSINNVIYAPIDAISKAFNVFIDATENKLQVYTLKYLTQIYDAAVQQWGYASIAEQSFENQKALLYGCIIVQKQGVEGSANGLYKIIDTNNTKEIVLDRYTSIEFSENIESFFVTDTNKKVGIVNLEGTTKIEPTYDSVLLLDKKSDLYIIEQEKKYGVMAGNGRSVIYPEYDKIGLNDNNIVDNKYLILDELIPVYKDKKWGAYNKEGRPVFYVVYDEIGYNLNSIEINGVKEVVQPVIAIERANAIVLKQSNKYGLFDVTGRELVRIAVDGIYAINGEENEEEKYFMLYNGEEINIIKRLIEAKLIEEKVEEIPSEDLENTTGNTIDGNNITNEVSGTVKNQNSVSNEV